jgi:uncharacterized membrane protein (DUF4010 family)
VDSPDLTVIRHFFVALLIGALVGTEREKRKVTEQEISFGGLRTFILFAQAGAVSAWLSIHLGYPWIFVATVAAISAIVVTGYILESRVRPTEIGVTTELAAITVCLLGGAVMYGFEAIAVGLAIVTSAVLAYKRPLHEAVAKIGTDDLYAGLKLLIATFIVLPLLPDRMVDPWQALNPYRLWFLVSLISGLSLVGYVAVRWLGPARGTLLTAASGGLVSSTAVSLSLARQSQTDTSSATGDALAAGVLVAWVVMFVRVIIAVAFVNVNLVDAVLVPFLVMAATAALLAGFLYWRGSGRGRGAGEPLAEVPLRNPFSLWEASKFGLLFAVVLLVVQLTQRYLHGEGLYVVAVIAGLTDVDAITLSMADYARLGGDPRTAVGAIVIAALANTVVKCGLAVALGSPALRRRLLPATVAILAVGIAILAASLSGGTAG